MLAEHTPVSLLRVMSAGQVIWGASLPAATVTLKLQLFVLPCVSLAEQTTLVVPSAKVEPDGGRQLTGLLPSQLSFAVGGV